MTLDGKVVMTIPASAIPDEFKNRNARSGQLALALTGLDVAPNGDLYVADGYASDYIHRFDRSGKYLTSFGGKKEPYNFSTLHKLAMDTRFQPVRIIACDRANNRVVHLSLNGEFLGVVAKDLLLPAAVTISGDYAIIGELKGQVSVLDKAGAVVARLGTNTGEGVGSNQLKPELWQPGHGRCRRTASPSTIAATSSSPNSTCSAASTGSTDSRHDMLHSSHPARISR